MQKWEYLYVIAIGGTVVRIQEYRNQVLFPIPNMLDEAHVGPDLIDFLNEFGREGWEVVTGMSSAFKEGERALIHLILKRPLE